jgi:hypothetical protein
MLAAQMGAVHMASMTFARRLAHVETIPQQDSASNAFNKLTRTFAAQMSTLKDYRSRGEQRMVVQHVNVAEGGQAIVGNVNAPARGGNCSRAVNNARPASFAERAWPSVRRFAPRRRTLDYSEITRSSQRDWPPPVVPDRGGSAVLGQRGGCLCGRFSGSGGSSSPGGLARIRRERRPADLA